MKLPQRERRQTSFFENSDDDSSDDHTAPPLTHAPGKRKSAPAKESAPTKKPPTPSKSKTPPSKKEATPPKKQTVPNKKGPVAKDSTQVLTPNKKVPHEDCGSTIDSSACSFQKAPNDESPAAAHAEALKPLVVGTLPHITKYSLQFPDVGLPFCLSTGHCGIRFKDGSCVLASVVPSSESETAAVPGKKRLRDADPTHSYHTHIYINRHRHRFSVRSAPATTDNLIKLIVPSPLERKFLALMWVKDVVANPHKLSQFGFVDGDPSQVSAAADMVDLASVMGGTVGAADFPLPLYVSLATLSADGTSATFELSNRSSVYPDRCYYHSDTET